MNTFAHKRILVTGATGLLGSHIVDACLRSGCSVVYAMARQEKKLTATFGRRENLVCIAHDVAQAIPQHLGHLDFIFHAASPIAGSLIKSHPVDVISANVTGTTNCLEYLKQQGSGRMIIFSSATVYGGGGGAAPVVSEARTEHADVVDSPNAPYAESKRMVEVIAHAYRKQYGVDSLIARFSYLYGYSANPADSAFYEFIFKALRGENLNLNKSGLPRRDNIYIDDAVDALLHLCRLGVWGETYNISSCGDGGNYAAIDEIAEIIANEVNRINPSSVRVCYRTESQGSRGAGLCLDNAKLKQTGWALRVGLREGIRETLLKYKERL